MSVVEIQPGPASNFGLSDEAWEELTPAQKETMREIWTITTGLQIQSAILRGKQTPELWKQIMQEVDADNSLNWQTEISSS